MTQNRKNIMQSHETYVKALVTAVTSMAVWELEMMIKKTKNIERYKDYYDVYKCELDKRTGGKK